MALLLHNGTLIDGTDAEPLPDAAVLIEDERITSVGPAMVVTAAVPPGTERVDLGGRAIIPGLIDCHDHLAHTERDLMAHAATPLSLKMLQIADNLRVTLEAGITTMRDAGGLDVGFKMAVERGLIPGPRLMLGLTIISRTGGIDDPRLRSGIDLDWRFLPGLPSPVADGVEEVRKRVREVLHAGADVVKCASTGGVSSQTLTALDECLTLEELQVIVDEARMLNKRTFVHAYGGPGLENAVIAGIDSIEHGAYLCRSPEAIRRMADQGTFLVPTFMVLALHREKGSPWAKFKATEMREEHRRTLEMAMAAGIPVAMGTDAGFYGHGRNATELRLMVDEGLTPMQSLVASTKTAAECLGLEAEIGTVEAGKLADIVVVDGDPLRDIALLERPEALSMVIKGGTVYVDRLAAQPERSLDAAGQLAHAD
jgi:imidazolonepropionase-like amidohydrolase